MPMHNGLEWRLVHPGATFGSLGYIPDFISLGNPQPARKQIDHNYRQGGGWRPTPKFSMQPNGALKYPGDPPLPLLAETKLRDETIRFYNHSWVAIVQPDGAFEVAKVD
jgi:hypothetical protein